MDRRVGSVFSQDTEYQHANTDLYVSIKIYPLRDGEFFHPSLLPFLFDWLMKDEKLLKRCQ